MKKKVLIIFVFYLLTFLPNNLQAETVHYLDLKYVLNQSLAGKKAQDTLKKRLENGISDLRNKEKELQNNEKKLIQQKKLISSEEYKKKVSELRKKVSSLQKQRNSLLEDISKKRSKAKNDLLVNLNPILKDYMKEKNIKIIIDKKIVLAADESLDITQDITNILNQKLKSIKIN